MLSDNPRMAQVPSKKKRAVGGVQKSWSDSQKIEVITTYLALGNLAQTCRLLKIPEITVRQWKQKQWWKDMEMELRTEENLQLSHRLQKIVESTLAVSEDRIANGDFIYDNRTGQLVRKPVNLKDAHKVAMDMMAKKEQLVSKRPENVDLASIDDRLAKLAAKFEQIAGARPVVEVTDVIFADDEETTQELEAHSGS